jgi:glycosyltransferase involved in cell wall biosynthesis
LQSIKDERLILIDQANMGMGASLNKGLALAKGKYIARQDHDDLSMPDRFKKQIAFLEANPEVAMLGTAAEIIDENGKSTGRFHRHVCQNAEIQFNLLFDNPFVHSSVMFRKEAVSKAGNYDLAVHSLVQDFELWFRFAGSFKLANLSDTLLKYRELQSGISRTSNNYAKIVAVQTWSNLRSLLSDEQLKEFSFFYHKCFDDCGEINSSSAKKIFKKIKNSFSKKHGLNEAEVKNASAEISGHLKKVCLDHKVYESGSNRVKKLVAKIERKILRPRK